MTIFGLPLPGSISAWEGSPRLRLVYGPNIADCLSRLLPENLLLTAAAAIYDPGDHHRRADPPGETPPPIAPTPCG